MTLESFLEDLAAEGWLVNNLFQPAPYLWQANLRRANDEWATDYGRGFTPLDALSAALEACCIRISKAPTASSIDPTPARSILADLGIEYKFHRRI
jgi:hypothetical protein